MPNLNYAQVWEPELLEILMQGALTSPFVTTNVRWLDAKTFHFTQMSTSGYKNHNRNGGWNKGNYVQKDVPFTVTHDRDISFLVDKADVDETNATASIQNISRTFEQTQVVPETDALFFSKVAQAAQKEEGYHSTTAIAAYTKAKVFGMLKDILAKGKLRRYKANGSLEAASGTEVVVTGSEFGTTQTVTKKELNVSGTVEMWENPLVSSSTLAADLAEWIGDYLRSDREYDLTYRGEPRIDANDIAFLENKYVPDLLLRIYEHTLKFNGALSGTIKARRDMTHVGRTKNKLETG